MHAQVNTHLFIYLFHKWIKFTKMINMNIVTRGPTLKTVCNVSHFGQFGLFL